MMNLLNNLNIFKKKSKQNNRDNSRDVCVEINAKESKLGANDTVRLIDKLFTDKHFISAEKTFIYGGYVQHYISLKQVVKHFANDPSVTIVTFNGDKYRCGKKVED